MQGMHEKRPLCSGSRMFRRVAAVAPAAVLLTMAFGTTGAMAAAGGNSTHANSAASPNMGVGNGNGNGKATGKPCAGCVGKADNKNPQGQKPNGSDHNAGYECDRNHGIGRSNPAHTGCKTTTPPPCQPTAENNYCGNPPQCQPTAENNYCG